MCILGSVRLAGLFSTGWSVKKKNAYEQNIGNAPVSAVAIAHGHGPLESMRALYDVCSGVPPLTFHLANWEIATAIHIRRSCWMPAAPWSMFHIRRPSGRGICEKRRKQFATGCTNAHCRTCLRNHSTCITSIVYNTTCIDYNKFIPFHKIVLR